MTISIRCLVPFFFSVVAFSATGCASSADEGGEESSEVRTRSDAQVKAAIERAAQGAIYVSETDLPYTWVGATLSRRPRALTTQLVIDKLGSTVDNPDGEQLHAKESSFEEFAEPGECSADTFPGPQECAKTQVLMRALKANLKNLKVFYVAPYENPSGDGNPTIFVIGITPEGNIGGVSTGAVWT